MRGNKSKVPESEVAHVVDDPNITKRFHVELSLGKTELYWLEATILRIWKESDVRFTLSNLVQSIVWAVSSTQIDLSQCKTEREAAERLFKFMKVGKEHRVPAEEQIN